MQVQELTLQEMKDVNGGLLGLLGLLFKHDDDHCDNGYERKEKRKKKDHCYSSCYEFKKKHKFDYCD